MGIFEIEIASLPDEEDLVAEIFYKDIQWVQISLKNQEFVIQFYNHPFQKHWEFSYDMAIQALEKAKSRLLEVG